MKVWKEALRWGVTLAAACGVAGLAAADVVVNRLDSGGGFDPQSSLVGASAQRVSLGPVTASRSAARFEVPSGRWFTLDSVTIPLSQQIVGTAGNFLRVRLAADLAGRPGATIEVLSLNAPVPAHGNPFTTLTTFESRTNPVLASGVRYWLVTELSALPTFATNGSYEIRWFQNTSGAASPRVLQQSTSALPTDPWPAGTTDVPLAFRVDGTPILDRACCNTTTGQCAVVQPAVCAGLDLLAVSGSITCTPSPCPPACRADVNASGTLTVQDLFDFLGAYFASCL